MSPQGTQLRVSRQELAPPGRLLARDGRARDAGAEGRRQKARAAGTVVVRGTR